MTMFTTWLLSGMYAKYIVSGNVNDSAQVADTGIRNMELLEHQAELKNGKYKLNDEEVTGNEYKKVIPGVDIPKDPFIRLELEPNVKYELYVKVTRSDPFPETVTYSLSEKWKLSESLSDTDQGVFVYKYEDIFNTEFNDNIEILKDNMIYVNEHYEGKGQTFSLTFIAWLKQVK